VNEPSIEPITNPFFRIGVAVTFLCFAALAIVFAWKQYERSGADQYWAEENEKNAKIESVENIDVVEPLK